MVDTGMAITLLIKKWADAHGLTMKGKVGRVHLRCQWNRGQDSGHNQHDPFAGAHLGAGCGKHCHLLWTDFYQGLLGCDLLCGHNEVLSAATITLPGPD